MELLERSFFFKVTYCMQCECRKKTKTKPPKLPYKYWITEPVSHQWANQCHKMWHHWYAIAHSCSHLFWILPMFFIYCNICKVYIIVHHYQFKKWMVSKLGTDTLKSNVLEVSPFIFTTSSNELQLEHLQGLNEQNTQKCATQYLVKCNSLY